MMRPIITVPVIMVVSSVNERNFLLPCEKNAHVDMTFVDEDKR